MLIIFVCIALVFNILALKLMSKTRKSGRIWLHAFTIFCGMVVAFPVFLFDRNPDGLIVGVFMATGACIGAVIALAIDTYLGT